MRAYTILLTGFLLTVLAGSLQAQSFPQPEFRSTGALAGRNPHNIKINFLSPFVLTANVAYEQFVSPKVSIQLGAYYNGISLEDQDFYWFSLPSARYRSFAITPEVRYYTGSAARTKLDGFYVAPFVRYQNTDIRITPNMNEDDEVDDQTYEGNLSTVRLGIVAGYKFIIGERLSLELFGGPSQRITTWLNANINTYNAEDFLPFGFGLRAGATIGYTF